MGHTLFILSFRSEMMHKKVCVLFWDNSDETYGVFEKSVL